MSMLVHITRASAEARIRKAGVRAGRCSLVTAEGPQVFRGVFLFPVLDNFALTFQWVRELRQHHDERALAVYVRGSDDEQVLVGRFGQSHQETSLGEAIRWVRAHPWGAQITLLRSVRAREVAAIRGITQLVGWVGAPHDTKQFDCVCTVCLPPGSRDIGRRVRASFQQHVRRARAATDPSEISAALRGTELALERLGAKVGIKPLLGFARHPDAQVRRITAWVLGICRSDTAVADQLARMTQDADEEVAATAARSLLGVAGRTRFLRAAEAMSEAALLEAVDDLRYVADARSILERLPRAAPAVQRRVEEVLATL